MVKDTESENINKKGETNVESGENYSFAEEKRI